MLTAELVSFAGVSFMHDARSMLAAEAGEKSALSLLLKNYDAKKDLKDKDGWSALMFAAKADHPACVKILIDQNCNIEARDKEYGMTAFLLACENGAGASCTIRVDTRCAWPKPTEHSRCHHARLIIIISYMFCACMSVCLHTHP